jgi:hypothetical protein
MICKRFYTTHRFKRLFKLLIITVIMMYITLYWFKQNKNTIINDDQPIEANRPVIQNKINTPIDNTKNAICIVLVSEQSILTRGVAVWSTWGSHCEKTVFTCSCPNIKKYNELNEKKEKIPEDLEIFKKVADFPIMYLDIEESYNKMGEKVIQVLKQVYNSYKILFQWYYMVDDDTYVFVDNLNKFTNSHDSTKALYYGFKFNVIVPNGYIGGGAGILFSNETMSRLVKNFENKACDRFIDGFGDITIGNCAHSVQVTTGDSLDAEKKPRFHPHDAKTHFYGPVPVPLYSAGSHNGKIGKDCCSLETISFHYVTLDDMYAMYANKTFLHDLLT